MLDSFTINVHEAKRFGVRERERESEKGKKREMEIGKEIERKINEYMLRYFCFLLYDIFVFSSAATLSLRYVRLSFFKITFL